MTKNQNKEKKEIGIQQSDAKIEQAKREASSWIEAECDLKEPVDRWDRVVQLFEMATSICLILSMIFCGAMAYRFIRFYPEPARLEIRVAPPETIAETTDESENENY